MTGYLWLRRLLGMAVPRPPAPLTWADSAHLIEVDEELVADARRDSVVPMGWPDLVSVPDVESVTLIPSRNDRLSAAGYDLDELDRDLLLATFGDDVDEDRATWLQGS